MSKDTILEFTEREVDFGGKAYGVEARMVGDVPISKEGEVTSNQATIKKTHYTIVRFTDGTGGYHTAYVDTAKMKELMPRMDALLGSAQDGLNRKILDLRVENELLLERLEMVNGSLWSRIKNVFKRSTHDRP